MQNLSHPGLLDILQTELLDFLFHCCLKFITILFDPWEILTQECICSKTKFWSQLHIFFAGDKLQLRFRTQSLCSLGSILLVVMLLLLLEECIHDRPLHEIVRDLQCLSSWSIVQFQQHPYKFAQFVFNSSSILLQWKILESTSVRKTVSTVSKSAALCINSFPCPLLLSRPLDNGLAARKIGHPLSANSNSIHSAILSHTPWLSSLIQCHFSSEQVPINDRCPFPNLLMWKDTSLAFAKHPFWLFFDPQEMSLNIDIKMIVPVNFFGVSSNLNSKLFTSSLSCNVLILGKIFHSNSIGSSSILSKFLYFWRRF